MRERTRGAPILEREAGLHGLEVADPGSGFVRTSARIEQILGGDFDVIASEVAESK